MAQPVLVLVTPQHACDRLIHQGAEIARARDSSLRVLHVANPDAAPIGEPAINARALDYLYALSGEVGAEMCVLTSSSPLEAIADYASGCAAGVIVMGGGERASGIAETFSHRLPGVQVIILPRS